MSIELVRKPASSSNDGELDSSSAQTIAGAKTFTGALTASSTLSVSGALTPSGGIVGRTDGVAVPAGYIGETQTTTFDFNTLTANTYSTSSGINLTPGVWLIDAAGILTWATGNTSLLIGISTVSTATSFSDADELASNYATGLWSTGTSPTNITAKASIYVNINTSTTYYAKAVCSGANARCRGRIRAVRIA